MTAPADLQQVREFWEAHPLYTGEAEQEPGTPGFFDEHRRVTLSEYGGRLAPIFTRDVRAPRDVLDVGCGIGFWVERFAGTGARVSACDLTASAVDLTRRRLESQGLTADVIQANAEDLPYDDASFDHVNCQGVIHHTPDAKACLRQFERVLRPGGTLSFSVYYRTLFLRSKVLFAIVTRLARPFLRLRGRGRERMLWTDDPRELVRRYDGVDNPIGRAYTRAEIEVILGDGFQVLEWHRFGLPRRALAFSPPDAFHRAASRALGLMIACRCRKTG